jgi:hypothetical protein
MRKAFDHVGMITQTLQSGEAWVEWSQVWVTNPRRHPGRLEYIRPRAMPDVPRAQLGLWKLWHWPHIAYRVEDLAAAVRGEEVVFGPFAPGDFVEVAFIHKDGVVLEYMQYSNLDHWFGDPNPPGFEHVHFT